MTKTENVISTIGLWISDGKTYESHSRISEWLFSYFCYFLVNNAFIGVKLFDIFRQYAIIFNELQTL